jgi:hypothetical protein
LYIESGIIQPSATKSFKSSKAIISKGVLHSACNNGCAWQRRD